MKIAFCKVCLRVICEILGYEIANCKLVCVQNQMYEIFELTDSIYNKRKDTVINEFQQAFSEEMNASTLKRLIYGD